MDFSSHNPKSSNALSLAARRNDVPNLLRLLKKLNPNCVDNRGWTCLHEAAFHDSLECLKIILRHRTCRTYVESHEGHTALYVACLNTFSIRCIKYLLEKVDDIANYGSREGFTPLHLVSRQGRIDALQLLIDHGAWLDVVDFDGDTPLHEACLAKQPEIVNILLHAGAQPELPNERKATPLHMACSRGCLETVKYLYPFVTDINARDHNGDTPLITACHGENEDVIQFILDHGGDPNIENKHGRMALDLALERGLVRGFKILFNATDQDHMGADLVYLALSPGNLKIDIVDTLLGSDLDPEFFMFSRPWMLDETWDFEIKYYYRSTMKKKELSSYKTFSPLSTFLNVAEYIFQLSVEKLKEYFCLVMMKGVEVNAMDEYEMPPLVRLLYCSHSDSFNTVLELLVQFGCDVDYCSEMLSTYKKQHGLKHLYSTNTSLVFKPYKQLDMCKMNTFPDAFYAALLIDPVTLPEMLTYSLHCDPGYILKSAYDLGAIERFPNETISQLMKIIDSNCEINDYEGFKHFVPPLKHLSRLKVRHLMKEKGIIRTRHYFELLDKLPLPKQIKQYLRFH